MCYNLDGDVNEEKFLNKFFILGLVLIPLILTKIMDNIFNDKVPQIISYILILSPLLGLLLFIIKIVGFSNKEETYSNQKEAHSNENGTKNLIIIAIVCGIIFLLFVALLIFALIEGSKSISEIGLILPIIK